MELYLFLRFIIRLLRHARILLVLVIAAGAVPASGQSSSRGHEDRLVVRVDGMVQTVSSAASREVSDPQDAAEDVLLSIQRSGYLHARLDSLRPAGERFEIFISSGPLVRLDDISVRGRTTLSSEPLVLPGGPGPGDALDISLLEDAVRQLVRHQARKGLVLARVHIADIELRGEMLDRATVILEIDDGPFVILSGVEAEGAERARDGYLARLTGLRPGQQLKTFDPEELRRRLEQTGHFRDVSLPRLVVSGDSAAIRFVVREEAPGSFDLAFGYLPGGSAGSLAGSGHLDLRNPLGYGRRFSANLERLPGQTSRVELSASDPYVLGTSMHGAVSFAGYQQDSLFHRQRFGIEMGFDLGGGLLAVGAATREATRPGVAGLQIDGSRQRIARTHGSMLGLGFRYSRIDNAVSPSRGLVVDLFAERGIRSQRLTRVVNGTPVREDRAIRQDRLEFLLRSYSRLSRRGVAVVGLDLRALISDEYDRSDLYRVGGLRTLRGYDDDLFLARAVGRTLLEYRHRLERRSYLFGFVDGAYLDRPPSVSLDGFSAARLGYGVGMQFDTGISLMNIVLATNPIDGFGSTRVHAGLSFGL